MEMKEQVFAMAKAVSGAGESEEAVLDALCAAALERWRLRLRDGVSPGCCGEALVCAAAFSAAADLAAGRSGISAFSAGAISVKLHGAGTPGELRKTAERLMEPFTAQDEIFLQGVEA